MYDYAWCIQVIMHRIACSKMHTKHEANATWKMYYMYRLCIKDHSCCRTVYVNYLSTSQTILISGDTTLSKLCCMICRWIEKVAPLSQEVAPPIPLNSVDGWRHLLRKWQVCHTFSVRILCKYRNWKFSYLSINFFKKMVIFVQTLWK